MNTNNQMTRREVLRALTAAGMGAGVLSKGLLAEERKENAAKAPLLLGVDSWSFSFACGMRRELKPAKPMKAAEILAKVRQWGLRGAQVGAGEMPPLGSSELAALRKNIEDAGLYWEVSAGSVQHEDGVRRAMEYNVAIGSKIVRSFLEGFGIQFKHLSLDDYVNDAIGHIKNLLPEFERRGLFLCLENHGGLRTRHLRRVLKTLPSEHLGLNLDTGNAVLTLEDPVAVAEEFAPRTYTCHLKDWNLIRNDDGLIARGCALGDGVVDLKAMIEILRAKAPLRNPLHLNIEAPQEYLPLKIFTADFWKWHGEVSGRELEHTLRLCEKRDMPPKNDYRIASMHGEPERMILAEEEAAIAQSVTYCRDVLNLI